MRGEPVIEWGESWGIPVSVGDRTVTPVSRFVVIRWPGGGSVSSGPAAVMVEREGRAERIPIGNLNRRILWAMRVGTVALVSAWMVKNRGRRSSDD